MRSVISKKLQSNFIEITDRQGCPKYPMIKRRSRQKDGAAGSGNLYSHSYTEKHRQIGDLIDRQIDKQIYERTDRQTW